MFPKMSEKTGKCYLAQELDQDDDLAKKFVLILIKIYRGGEKIIHPLEVVADLSGWATFLATDLRKLWLISICLI